MIRRDYFKISEPIIGVDIGYDTLKIVQTRQVGKKHRILAYSKVPIPPRSLQHVKDSKQIVVDALKKGLGEAKPHRISSNYVISGLPESKVFTTVLKVPPMTLREMAEAVPLQAGKYVPIPIESLTIDFQPLAPNWEGSIDVLVIAAPTTLVERYAEIFSEVGLSLFALETKPIANSRSLLTEDDIEPILIVDIGAEGCGLTLFDNKIIRFTTSLPQGGNIFTKSISTKLGISEQEAESLKRKYGITEQNQNVAQAIQSDIHEIVEEINRAISYYEARTGKNKRVSKIRLCGGAAQTPGIVEFMQKTTKKQVEIGNLLVNTTPNSKNIFTESSVMRYSSAIGLALRQGYF
ncbi:MAG: type IV pilus assembly protein PilM [bacterium]